MAASDKRVTAPPGEVRVDIPPQLLELFTKEPRVVLKHRFPGLWPIDPGMLVDIDWATLARSRNFTKNFEVLIMPKV